MAGPDTFAIPADWLHYIKERRSFLLRWLAFLTVVTLIGLGIWRYATQPTVLTVAVGPPDSERVAFVKDIARRLIDGRHPVRLKLVITQSGRDAAKMLEDETVQLAVARSDEAGLDDARSIVILDKRSILLITRALDPSANVDTPVAAPAAAPPPPPSALLPTAKPSGKPSRRANTPVQMADPPDFPPLAGKRLVIGMHPLGSARDLIARLLPHAGFIADAQNLREVPIEMLGDELASGRADVAVMVVEPTAARTRAIITTIKKRLGPSPIIIASLPMPEALAQIYRELIAVDLPKGLLGGLPPLPAQKIPTVAVTDELIADSDLADSTVTALTKALLEIRGRTPKLDERAFEIEPPPVDQRRRFMAHSGTVAHIQDRAQSFFDTYSDQIWLSVLGLGVVGSSIVGLLGWFGLTRPKPKDELTQEIDRLITSIDQLNSLAEVDDTRTRLRRLAARQSTIAVRKPEDEQSPLDDPASWYPLADRLAERRATELGASSDSQDRPNGPHVAPT